MVFVKSMVALALFATPLLGACDEPDVQPQLTQAEEFVHQKDWPQALAVLRALVDDANLERLPADVQYRTLALAARVAWHHGPADLGYDYLGRLVASPDANYDDWLEWLRAADKRENAADATAALTVLVRRWPERLRELNAGAILYTVDLGRHRPAIDMLPLERALYDAHWTLDWEREPNSIWRDLAVHLLAVNRPAEARQVVDRITDVYVLIALRADRRFDALATEGAAWLDIDAVAERELQRLQGQVDETKQSLTLRAQLIGHLLTRQRYGAALAAADAVYVDIRSTNFPEKLFEDFIDAHAWFLEMRSLALQRLGRFDEAVTAMTEASRLSNKFGSNITQAIDLGELYCALGRPKDALSAINQIVASMNPSGTMREEAVRLDAARQLHDRTQAARSLDYLTAHRTDAPSTYVDALLTAQEFDRAARELIEQLTDADSRSEALLSVQIFAQTPGTPREAELVRRRRTLVARADVQAAIRRVGRVDAYDVEDL